jgi:hypothetical protein
MPGRSIRRKFSQYTIPEHDCDRTQSLLHRAYHIHGAVLILITLLQVTINLATPLMKISRSIARVKSFSKNTVIILTLLLCVVRLAYVQWPSEKPITVLTWDAFGYYMLLPAIFIYDDYKTFSWVDEANEKYALTGEVYQLSPLPNGDKVMKYLLGISILYAPFFLLGHGFALLFNYPIDGFSLPYQAAIAVASIFYAFVGLWFLRLVLSRYVTDKVVALTLALIVLGTNYIQYVSVDSGMTHGYLFALYALVLYLTIRWHEKPTPGIAVCLGALIGLSVISRPTEIIIILIPILYGFQKNSPGQPKWALVKNNKEHIAWAILGGLIGVLPQLIYWKVATGAWMYDVGSKFLFFNPHWQVLFGWEKGWFIYTPIAIFMIGGLLLLKRNKLAISIIAFTLCNTWIIIAWSDWHYGASYSARALVQSYAVLSVPLALSVNYLVRSKLRLLFIGILLFLLVVNLFQIYQYNKTILHYRDMNKLYYASIFLDADPSPVDMSLLDTREVIADLEKYTLIDQVFNDSIYRINKADVPADTLLTYMVPPSVISDSLDAWIKVTVLDSSSWGAFNSHIIASVSNTTETKQSKIRLHNGICKAQYWNTISFFYKMPPCTAESKLDIYAQTEIIQDIYLKDVEVSLYTRPKSVK